MSLKVQTIDESLKAQELGQKFDSKAKKVKTKKVKKTKVKKTKSKKKKIAIVALIVAGVLAITAGANHLFGKKNKDNTNTKVPTSTTQEDTETKTPEIENSLSDLGVSLEFPKEEIKTEYKNPSNDKIDTNKVVEDENGTLWVDKEAKEESSNIGKVEIDTKDDTLIVKPDGTVFEKEEGYEIKNDKDEVVSSGDVNENGIPDGYVEDKTTGDLYKENDVYIDPEGNAWDSKEKYEAYLESLKTDGEIVNSEFIPTESDSNNDSNNDSNLESNEDEKDTTIDQVIEEGVINPDGTYTIYGTTYESKEDFEQFLLTPDAYAYYNGMIVSLETIEQLNSQLTR